jgi:hypothetical protein
MLQLNDRGMGSCGSSFCWAGFLPWGKMEGHDFLDMNQVMQKAVIHEN